MSRFQLRTFLLVVTLLFVGASGVRAETPLDASTQLYMDALDAMKDNNFEKAKQLFEKVVATKPPKWAPFSVVGKELIVAYWDSSLFKACIKADTENYPGKENIKAAVWKTPSYSSAYYHLAFIALEQRKPDQAITLIDKALALEPDHPNLLQEKAIILSGMGHKDMALALFDQSLNVKRCITDLQRAKALRGKGVILIDKGQLDQAEKLFAESLVLDPTNKVAKNELVYIDRLKKGMKPITTKLIDTTSPRK